MEPGGDSIVLEEEIDPNYEPTEKEVHEYASWLGMDLDTEQDLFWIAREGLKAPLPENWKPCKTTDTEEIYYFNFASGQSTWDHPCDEYYRKVYDDHKKKRPVSSRGGVTTDGDERKKKEKEDVAELLGKKPSKKKRGTTLRASAESLGPPVLARGAALSEKKPLPGLSSGKLKGLSGSLGSGSSLRPTASLGRLKGEAKDDGHGAAVDNHEDEEDEETEHVPSPRALSKPPLGSLLSKKPLPTTSSLSKADTKAELEEVTTGFELKKQKLIDEHAKALRALEDDHDATLNAQKKKNLHDLEELQEQQEMSFKQCRKECDKKLNDIENQYDKDESNLLRERKEKLKRLESDMESMLSEKKQECERDHHKEVQRMQARLDATLEELRDDHAKKEKLLKQKTDGLSSAFELATEVEKLKSEVRRFEQQAAGSARELETLRQAQAAAEERSAAATQQIEALKKQLNEANDEVVRQQNRAADPSTNKQTTVECSECPAKARKIVQLEAELETERQQIKSAEDALVQLQHEKNAICVAFDAERKAAVTAADELGDGEMATLRQVEADLRRDLKDVETKHATIAKELGDWKTKCSTLEEQKEELVAAAAAAKQKHTQELLSAKTDEPNTTHADELEELRNEIGDLQDQVASLAKTNVQIKDQLLKESNEKKQLREQLDTALTDDNSRELSHKVDQQQREIDSLQQRLHAELASKDQQLQALQAQLHTEQQTAEQTKRRLDAEVVRLESENRKLAADGAMLKRQMDERVSEVSQAGDAAEQQAAATMTTQKWEIEQLQSSLKLVTRDNDELALRISSLETEVNSVIQSKHKVEVERDSEAVRAKKKDAEREAIQQNLTVLQEELDAQVEKTRAATSENADVKTQLHKLKFKEQATQDKYAQLADDCKALETKSQAQQSDVERLTRELRIKASQLDEKTNALRDAQGETEVLNDQLSDTKRQLVEWRARTQGSTSAQLGSGGGAQGSGEVAELRLRASELEAKVESLAQEKAQLMDKQRALTQKQLTAEASQRAMEAERDRLMDECQSLGQDAVKWKERLEKKTREAEQLKADLFTATSEKELVEMALNKERDEKREVTAQKMQLDKTKKQLEITIESLTSQLAETESTQGRTALETQAQQSKFKRVENELETLTREFRTTQGERDALAAKAKQQASDMAALETRVRLLRTENNEQNARAKTAEEDATRQTEAMKRLEVQLGERDARLRKESDERETLAKQLAVLRSEKEEIETDLLAMKRKSESVEARYKDHESAASRGDFQLKLRVQQLEAERDGIATAKDRAEQHAKTLEKESLHAKEELGTIKSEFETARSRIKALTLERDDFQTALLQAQSKSSQATSRGNGHEKGSGLTADAILVRLQLADVNKSELEHHLADVATQLELATRRCTLAETRCRDQSVALESLHVEIASLRASMAKMHASALETLPLVERLEYEHRKRTLKRDFSAQLRDFQAREEHGMMRRKARTRAQHEKQVEELVDELDAKKQRRIEYEEQVTTQMLSQLRSERDAQLKEVRAQLERELVEEERVLVDRKERRLESVAATVRQDEDDERARLREQRQIRREQALAGQDDGDCNGSEKDFSRMQAASHSGDVSPGQLRSATAVAYKSPARRSKSAHKTKRRLKSDDESDNDSDDSKSESERGVQQRQARKAKHSTSRRDDTRHIHRHEREMERWRQRLAEETTLLDKAKALLADQKKQLKKQADKIKTDKLAWKREWVTSDSDASSHRVAILQEMKAMIDHSAASWNTSMHQLRDREEWLQKRELKLRKMRRALASLRDKGRSTRSRSRGRRGAKALRFGSSSSDSEDDDNQRSIDVDSDAVLDKLARLDGELASDASEFSSDDRWPAATARPSSSYTHGFDRHEMYSGGGGATAAVAYRHPLSMALVDGSVAAYRLSDPVDARAYRSPSLSTRTMTSSSSMLGGSSSSRLSQRVWPTTATRLTLQHRGVGNQASDAAVQRRVARWAHGRETMQHAATKQASWLSNLYQEVKAYGDTRAQATAEAEADAATGASLGD